MISAWSGRALLWIPLCLAGLSACSAGSDTPTSSAALPADTSGAQDTFQPSFGADAQTGLDAAPDAGFDTAPQVAPDVSTPDVATGPSCPGGSGCACNANADCDNALCIEAAGGKHCAHACVDNCPEGLKCAQVSSDGGDVVSICVPKDPHLCDPCAASSACTSLGAGDGVCVDRGAEGAFCGVACVDAAGCPAGYGCVEVSSVEGSKSKQCVPIPEGGRSGLADCTCSATAVAAAMKTACWVEQLGPGGQVVSKCPGVRTCTADGLSACVGPEPEAEVCDGVDNDCDGKTDEDTCDDSSTCTVDSCEGAQGCSHQPLSDGLACDADGNPCTDGDACKAGVCAPGKLKNCDDGNPCTQDACAMAVGCTQTWDDGAPCSDDNPCTIGDTCLSAQCKAGVVKDCPSGKPCVVGDCSLQTGKCVFDNQQEGKACDDGDACTEQDGCKAGKCQGTVTDCSDSNPCTVDACDPQTGCSSKPGAGACSDGNPCTLGDACEAGACKPGGAKVCDDSNACTSDACDLKTGACQNLGAPLEGKACDADGSACTPGDVCAGGQCKTGQPTVCSDGKPCTADSCDPATGQCVFDPKPLQDKPCDADNDGCTVGDSCQAGLCAAGPAAKCADPGVACLQAACVSLTAQSFKCANLPKADASPCSDGDACTVVDFCKGGKCFPGGPKSCPGQGACLLGTCNSADGTCGTKPGNEGQVCDDGSNCTAGDVCTAGVCKGKGLQCDDGNPCTDDACNGTGCVHLANNAACDDNNACTQGDGCVNKACSGAPVNCQDGNLCTEDFCSQQTGCVFPANTALCPDADPCTTGEVCSGGKCVSQPTSCDDLDVCTIDACTPGVGCKHGPAANNLDCGGGNWCQAGKCVPKAQPCNVTWSPTAKGPAIVLSNGNKTIKSTASWQAARATLGRSTGKWYFEVVAVVGPNGFNFIGVGTSDAVLNGCCTGNTASWGYYGGPGNLRGLGASLSPNASPYKSGTFVIGVAVDLDLHRIWWSLNGVWQLGSNPASGSKPHFSNLGGTLYPQSSVALDNATSTLRACGDELKYAPPSGFTAWGG